MQSDSLVDKLRKQKPHFTQKQIKRWLVLDENGTLSSLITKLEWQELQLKEMQQKAKNYDHSIIDQLIYKNLVMSFKASCIQHPDTVYNKEMMEKFRKELLEKVRELKIQNYQLVQEIKSPLKSEDFYNKILNIRNKLHPIFVPDLIDIVSKSGSTVKGKDVVAIFGQSGAGKSTLSQILLGYQLHEVTGVNGLKTLEPTVGLKQQHRQFITSASTKSATKKVTATLLNLPQKYKQLGEIYLADTPGFNDSEGALVDAANSLATMRVLTGTNSIRFIFIINEKNIGTRMEGLRQLVKIISKIFKVYDKSKVLYFLNRFSNNQIEQIVKQVNQLNTKGLNADEKGIPNFLQIINHFGEMLKKAADDAKKLNVPIKEATKKIVQLLVMDPLDPDIQQIYKKIAKQNIVVTNPKQLLVNMVSETAMKSLQNQTSQLQSIINSLILKDEIAAAAFYIKQLKDYGELTKTDDIAKANTTYQNVIQRLSQKFRHSLGQFSTDVNEKILSYKSNEKVFEEALKIKKQLQIVQQSFKCLKQDGKFNYKIQIQSIIDQAYQFLKNNIEQASTNPRFAQTIEYFSKYFKIQLMQQMNKMIEKQQMAINDQIKAAVEQQNYLQLEDLLVQIKPTSGTGTKGNKIVIFDWQTVMNKNIKQRMSKLNEIYNRKDPQLLKISQIEYTKKSFQIYNKQIVSKNVNIANLARHAEQIQKMIIKYVNSCKTQYQNDIKNSKYEDQPPLLETVNEPIKILQQLVQIEQVKQYTQNKIRDVDNISINKVINYLQNMKDIQLDDKNQDNVRDKVNKIFTYLMKVRNFSKIITDYEKLIKTQQHITQSQIKIAHTINSYYENHISKFEFDSKNIKETAVEKIQRGCVIVNVVLTYSNRRLEYQLSENVIYKQCLNVKDKLKDKLSVMIDKIWNYIQDYINLTSFQYIVQNLSRFKKDFQQILKIVQKLKNQIFKVLDMAQKIQFIHDHFSKTFINMMLFISDQAKSELEQFHDFFENVEEKQNAINLKAINEFFGKVNLLKQFVQVQEFTLLFKNNCSDVEQRLQQIQSHLKNLQVFAMQRYKKVVIEQQKYYFDSVIFQSCKNLKFSCVPQMKEQLLKHSKQQSIDLTINPSDLIHHSGNFQKTKLKKYYASYLKFGKNAAYIKKRQDIKQKLKDTIQNKVHKIQSLMNSIRLKRQDSLNQINQFISHYHDLLLKIKDIQDIINDEPEILNFTNQFKVKANKKITQIIKSYQKKLDEATEPSSKFSLQKYKDQFENYQYIVKQLSTIQLPQQIQTLIELKKNIFQNYDAQKYYNQVRNKKKAQLIAQQQVKARQQANTRQIIAKQQAIAKQEVKKKQQELKAIELENVQKNKQEQIIKKQLKKTTHSVTKEIRNQQSIVNVQSKSIVAEQVEQKDKFVKDIEEEAKIHKKIESKQKKSFRTVFLLSNTHLMEKTVKYLKKSINEVVKQQNSIQKKCQFKIMFVRNYNSKYQHIFSQTKFQSEAKNLQQHLKNVKFMGGWDTLALQIPLHCINQLSDVDQVIAILRQRANTVDEVHKKMQIHGKEYWQNNGISVYSVEQQINKLKDKGIPVHCLYQAKEQYFKQLNQVKEQYFKQLSSITKGTSQKYTVNDKLSNQIINFISARIKQQIQKV